MFHFINFNHHLADTKSSQREMTYCTFTARVCSLLKMPYSFHLNQSSEKSQHIQI